MSDFEHQATDITKNIHQDFIRMERNAELLLNDEMLVAKNMISAVEDYVWRWCDANGYHVRFETNPNYGYPEKCLFIRRKQANGCSAATLKTEEDSHEKDPPPGSVNQNPTHHEGDDEAASSS